MPWDPCWYVSKYFKNTKEFPIDQTREVGRWLGVSKNDADVVTYKILTVRPALTSTGLQKTKIFLFGQTEVPLPMIFSGFCFCFCSRKQKAAFVFARIGYFFQKKQKRAYL